MLTGETSRDLTLMADLHRTPTQLPFFGCPGSVVELVARAHDITNLLGTSQTRLKPCLFEGSAVDASWATRPLMRLAFWSVPTE